MKQLLVFLLLWRLIAAATGARSEDSTNPVSMLDKNIHEGCCAASVQFRTLIGPLLSSHDLETVIPVVMQFSVSISGVLAENASLSDSEVIKILRCAEFALLAAMPLVASSNNADLLNALRIMAMELVKLVDLVQHVDGSMTEFAAPKSGFVWCALLLAMSSTNTVRDRYARAEKWLFAWIQSNDVKIAHLDRLVDLSRFNGGTALGECAIRALDSTVLFELMDIYVASPDNTLEMEYGAKGFYAYIFISEIGIRTLSPNIATAESLLKLLHSFIEIRKELDFMPIVKCFQHFVTVFSSCSEIMTLCSRVLLSEELLTATSYPLDLDIVADVSATVEASIPNGNFQFLNMLSAKARLRLDTIVVIRSKLGPKIKPLCDIATITCQDSSERLKAAYAALCELEVATSQNDFSVVFGTVVCMLTKITIQITFACEFPSHGNHSICLKIMAQTALMILKSDAECLYTKIALFMMFAIGQMRLSGMDSMAQKYTDKVSPVFLPERLAQMGLEFYHIDPEVAVRPAHVRPILEFISRLGEAASETLHRMSLLFIRKSPDAYFELSRGKTSPLVNMSAVKVNELLTRLLGVMNCEKTACDYSQLISFAKNMETTDLSATERRILLRITKLQMPAEVQDELVRLAGNCKELTSLC